MTLILVGIAWILLATYFLSTGRENADEIFVATGDKVFRIMRIAGVAVVVAGVLRLTVG